MTVAAAAASHSFWSSTLATVLVVAVCALIVAVAVAVMVSRRSMRASVRQRVGLFVSAPTSAASAGQAPSPSGGLLSLTERSLERERWWDEFKEKLDIARIDRPAVEVVYLTVGFSIAGAVLLAVIVGNPLVGLLPLFIIPLLSRALVDRRLERQRALFSDQLPAHLQELAAAMRAGHSMISGIGVMADGASEPTRGEFQRVIADERLGLPLEDALRVVAGRMRARDMEQVSLVAELHRQTGGNMAEVLDRVAEAVRERSELNRELRALTAQARGSRWVVSSLPPLLLGAIALLNPNYLKPLFDTSTGEILLVVAALMLVGGSLVMGRVVRIEA